MKKAAQALGLRPWLAALPLRERRLRARLLMCYSKNWDGQWPVRMESCDERPVRVRSPLFLHSRQSGDDLAHRAQPVKEAINTKSPQIDVVDRNPHGVYTTPMV